MRVELRQIFLKYLLFIISIASIPCHAYGAANNYSALQFRPSPFKNRTITVDGSSMQEPGNFSFGSNLDYSMQTLRTNVPGFGTKNIITNPTVLHLMASGAAFDFLSFGLSFPIVIYDRYTSPTSGKTENQFGNSGDLLLALKFNLLNNKQHLVGLGIMPFITFPTDSGSFIGANHVTGGGKFIIDFNVDPVIIMLNAGYLARGKSNVLGTNIDDKILLGFSTSIKLDKCWHLYLEMFGSTVAGNAFKNKKQTPMEALLAANYDIPKTPIRVAFGGSAGVIKGLGAPLFRVFTEFSYQYGKEIEEEVEEPEVIEETPQKVPPELLAQLHKKVYFKNGGALLSSDAKYLLSGIPKILNLPEMQGIGLLVAGHSDSTGKVSANQKLSTKRAKAVGDYLTSIGVDPNRIFIIGYGSEKPEASNNTLEGRQMNRRVNVTPVELDKNNQESKLDNNAINYAKILK